MKDEFLEILVKAIDDALNHAHYSLIHPDTETPMEHNEWKHQWLLKNVPLYKQKCEDVTFDCSKYNKREGQGCDLNNNCKYPNCNYICHG